MKKRLLVAAFLVMLTLALVFSACRSSQPNSDNTTQKPTPTNMGNSSVASTSSGGASSALSTTSPSTDMNSNAGSTFSNQEYVKAQLMKLPDKTDMDKTNKQYWLNMIERWPVQDGRYPGDNVCFVASTISEVESKMWDDGSGTSKLCLDQNGYVIAKDINDIDIYDKAHDYEVTFPDYLTGNNDWGAKSFLKKGVYAIGDDEPAYEIDKDGYILYKYPTGQASFVLSGHIANADGSDLSGNAPNYHWFLMRIKCSGE